MAGLKVLQLISDNTAVALNYGVFRRKDIDATAKVRRTLLDGSMLDKVPFSTGCVKMLKCPSTLSLLKPVTAI